MSFSTGFAKTAAAKDEDRVSPRNAFLGGLAVGAAKNIAHDAYLNHRERGVANSKSIKKFMKNLKPGDVLISGSTPRNAGGYEVADLPRPVQKLLKKFKVNKNHQLINNSTLLTAIGGGGKYHAGIYVGKGRVAHLTTDAGTSVEHLNDVMRSQNMAAYRFKDVKKREAESAVRFAKGEAKKKTPYQSFARYSQQALGNVLSPTGLPACRKRKGGMVCNTLPVRAYHKRRFPHGEWTYSGDLRRAPGLKPVARRDVVKLPWHLKTRSALGHATKGIKWGLGAAAAAAAANKINELKTRDES